jgi:hypothetical protein
MKALENRVTWRYLSTDDKPLISWVLASEGEKQSPSEAKTQLNPLKLRTS